MQKLDKLSEQYRETKIKFLNYSSEIKSTFNLAKEQIAFVAYGIEETSNTNLQKYVDILNNDHTINILNKKLTKIKLEGINTVLEYALECDEKISGYDINILLKNPYKNRYELFRLFEGLAGVQHIHLFNGKIMMELPARGYITKNRKLLRYVDFWYKELQKES